MAYKKLTREFVLKTIKDNSQPAVKVTGSKDAADFARAFFSNDIDIYESAFLILLDRSNNVVGWAKISLGGFPGYADDVDMVCLYALNSLAFCVYIVHNCPSGNLTPSMNEINHAKRIEDALDDMDVRLLDSIRITAEAEYSMFQNGNLYAHPQP